MTEPRDLPRVSDEEFAEELDKVRGEGHILIERLLLDHRDASEALGYAEATNHRQHEEVESLRARLIVAEDYAVVLRSGLTFVEVERDAALRERDEALQYARQVLQWRNEWKARAEQAEARVTRLREVLVRFMRDVLHYCDDQEAVEMMERALAETGARSTTGAREP